VNDYFLSLANDAPHKNLDVTVAAWVSAFAEEPDPTLVPPLVVAGRFFAPERREQQRRLVAPRLQDRLVQLDGVTDRGEVKWLLLNARAMISSATLEAHPLTPAEAGSLGCPLILSDIPAHREVAGDHAVYVAPANADNLVQAIRALGPGGESAGPGARPASRPTWTAPTSWDENARLLAAVLVTAGDRGGPEERR